jgi:hypothetical protein
MAYKGTVTTARLACIFVFAGLSACGVGQSSTNSATPATTPAAPATPAAPTIPATPAAAPKTEAPPTTSPPTSSLVTNFNNGDACVAQTLPPTQVLFGTSKKVFAHYFFPFPVSIDNAAPASDYYNTQYLTKTGEANKWLAHGGYLRQRPLGRTSTANAAWLQLNMEAEIKAAMARGITGFAFDVMSVDEATGINSPLQRLLAAALAVDSRFKIMVMPDISALQGNSSAVVQIIASVASSPTAYRLSDGRLVSSAFDAGLNSAAWWTSVLSQLNAKGINVAFVPVFLGWQGSVETFAPISYGISDWGTATAASASALQADPEILHNTYGKIFMMPINPQQFRPKDFTYWEAGNSAAFRNGWMSAINGDADSVQLVTWNDFSESGQISPYTDATLRGDIGTGYYDMNAFYAAWFLTGQQPTITHDVLYYFYRREPGNAAGPAQSQLDTNVTGTAENDIELVAFLTAPGTLKITIGGKTYTQDAAAGIASFKIPAQPGIPLFTLSRSGTDVFSFVGGVQIYGLSGIPSGVQDLTYWSGSAAKSGICRL